MARVKIDWNLNEAVNKGMISMKEQEVKTKVGRGEDKREIKGSCTIVGTVVRDSDFAAHLTEVLSKSKGAKTKREITFAYLLRRFINGQIIAYHKQYLKAKADPVGTVNKAIAETLKKFPNLPKEAQEAMKKALLASMTAE